MLNHLQWQRFKNLEICYTEIIVAVNDMERILKHSFPEEYTDAIEGWLPEIRKIIKSEDDSQKTIKKTLEQIQTK